jgi:hypothetical protein
VNEKPQCRILPVPAGKMGLAKKTGIFSARRLDGAELVW